MRLDFVTNLRIRLSRYGAQVLLLLLWLFLSGMTIAGALVSSSSIDESAHERFIRDDFLNFHGWLANGAMTPRPIDGHGNAFEFLGHIVNVILGNDKWLSTISTTPHGIAGRHLAMALVGIYGSILAYRITRILTENLLVSMIAGTALMAIPMWSGSAFFNPVDTPTAVGLAGLTLLFTRLLKGHALITMPAVGWRKHRTVKFLTPVILSFEAAFFVFISVGARPGILALAGLLTLLSAILLIARKQLNDVISLTVLLLLGVYASVIVNPLSYSNPLKYFWDEMTVSSQFGWWDGVNLIAGHLTPGRSNIWWYAPAWFGAQTPLLIELVLIGGCAWLISTWVKRIRSASKFKDYFRALIPAPREYAFLPTFALLAVPLGYAIVFHPAPYNASRHLMMVYPAMAVLFGLAVHKILILPKNPGQSVTVSILLAVSLLAPTWEGLGLFPYNYVYINPVARLFGTNGHWDFDYWKLSLPEAVRLAPPSASWITFWPYSVPANHPTPYWIAGWIDPNFPALPSSCQKTYVTRPLGLSTIRLSYLAICTD